MAHSSRFQLLAIAAATALTLAACGGGGDDSSSSGGGSGSTLSASFSGVNSTPTSGSSTTVPSGTSTVEIKLGGAGATGTHDVRVDIKNTKSQVFEKATFGAGGTSQIVTFTEGKATVELAAVAGETFSLELFYPPDSSNTTPFGTLSLSANSGSGGNGGGSGGATLDCTGVGAPATITSTHPATDAEKCAILTVHNDARAAVGVPDLTWSDAAANLAYSYAQQHAAAGCGTLTHNSNRGNYGENIAWGSGSRTVTAAVTQFVSEKQYYNYATNSCASGKMCGHYTQVVWKNTTGVGCGSAMCSDGGVITVCNYTPPGNYVGQKPY